MPRDNTPREAFERYIAPFREAIRCIAHGTLLTSQLHTYRVGELNAIVLNNSDPVPLRSSPAITFSMGQNFRIVEDDTIEEGPYRVHTAQYWYLFALEDGREILAYHWTPELSDRQQGSGQRAYPHIHIGPALLASDSPIFPTTFHKKHVPSERVSIESIIRFAIEELNVSPILSDWDAILTHNQSQFDQHRRR